MGHDNLDRALAAQRGIVSATSALVLLNMARWAHDDREPPRYWLGAQFLADALECDDRTIRRAWADLVRLGLIKDDGNAGRRRVWVLNLPLSTDGDNAVHSPDGQPPI